MTGVPEKVVRSSDCWTLRPERGRKLKMEYRRCRWCLSRDCWTLRPERGRKLEDADLDLVKKRCELLDSSPREGTETDWLSDIKVSEENVLFESSIRLPFVGRSYQ